MTRTHGNGSDSAGRSWLTTSKVLFTVVGVNADVTKEALSDRVRIAKDAGADALMFLVELDGYALWPSRVVKNSDVSGGIDVVGEVRELCAREGIRFISMWMGCHCQSLHIHDHPSWMQRDAHLNPNAAMCLNSPYGGLLIEQVDEVVSAYQPDAIYFDGLYARLGGCYCDYCQQQFRARHGRPIPDLTDPSQAPVSVIGREHWLSFSAEPVRGDREHDEFRYQTVLGFLQRVKGVLTARGDVPLLLDTLGVTAAYYTNAHDLPRMAEFVDGFILESYWEHLAEPVWHVGFEANLVRAETSRPVFWARWVARHPDGDQVSVPPATIRLWAAQAAVHRTPPLAAEQNIFQVDRTLEGEVRHALESVGSVIEALDGTEPVRYAALLHSPATKGAYHAEWRSREYFDCLEGTYQLLLENHVPTEIVLDTALTSERLRGFRVVVVPNAADLAPGAIAALREFAESGGGVVGTFQTGSRTRPETGDGLIHDLFGIRVIGIGFRSGRVGPEQFGAREPVNYIRVGADHAIAGDLADRIGSFKGAYARVVPGPDTETAAMVLSSDYRLMDGSRYFSWYPGRPESPYLVTSEVGKGRTAYVAADPGASHFRGGSDIVGDLLVRAIVWGAGRNSPEVRIDAPSTVDSYVATDPRSGRVYVVLANRTTHELYATGRPSMTESGPNGSTTRRRFAREVVPVAGVTIAAGGAGGRDVQALRGSPFEVTTRDGSSAISIPRLDDLEVIEIAGPDTSRADG